MQWQPPQAEMHFTLFFLQGHLLVVQSPKQLQETNCSKFAGAMSSKVIMGSNCPALLTCHPYNFGSLDILFKSIQFCICRYTLRECCIAKLFVGGRLAEQMTPPFACLLYLQKCCMNNIASMLSTEKSIFQHCWYLQWKLHHSKTYQWSVLTVQNISFGFDFVVYINIKVVDQNNKNICIFNNNTNVTSQGIFETSFHCFCFCIISMTNAANVGNSKFCWYHGHQHTLIWNVWKKLFFSLCMESYLF